MFATDEPNAIENISQQRFDTAFEFYKQDDNECVYLDKPTASVNMPNIPKLNLNLSENTHYYTRNNDETLPTVPSEVITQ